MTIFRECLYPGLVHSIIVILYRHECYTGKYTTGKFQWAHGMEVTYFLFIIWLVLSCAVIGYPSGQDGAILPARDTSSVPQWKFIMFWCFIPYNISFIDQACSVKMAGYWPRSFFACLWTSTSSRSINTQKKNLANIQPSWPHAWSITHTYGLYRYVRPQSRVCFFSRFGHK